MSRYLVRLGPTGPAQYKMSFPTYDRGEVTVRTMVLEVAPGAAWPLMAFEAERTLDELRRISPGTTAHIYPWQGRVPRYYLYGRWGGDSTFPLVASASKRPTLAGWAEATVFFRNRPGALPAYFECRALRDLEAPPRESVPIQYMPLPGGPSWRWVGAWPTLPLTLPLTMVTMPDGTPEELWLRTCLPGVGGHVRLRVDRERGQVFDDGAVFDALLDTFRRAPAAQAMASFLRSAAVQSKLSLTVGPRHASFALSADLSTQALSGFIEVYERVSRWAVQLLVGRGECG